MSKPSGAADANASEKDGGILLISYYLKYC